jgi:phosphoribosylformimino-5-aminoimidazole carboxamide ribotide isomerase
MDLILAMDLKEGSVVHGSRGERATYRPLTWGISPVAEPVAYTKLIGPRFLYIADIDRILGIGNHDEIIRSCATLVDHCYVDRGCRNPGDYLAGDGIVNIVGTETGGVDLSIYEGGFISLDIKGGLVIPSGKDPETMLREANRLPFEGCIILDIGAVGSGDRTTCLPSKMQGLTVRLLRPRCIAETYPSRGSGRDACADYH